MNNATKHLAFALSFGLIAIALGGCNQRHTLRIGDAVEPVELEDVYGKTMTLPDDVKGKVTLVRFWSIDCPLCCKEMIQTFESLYQKYKDKGFIPVAINVGHHKETAEDYKKLEGVTYPLLTDPNYTVARRFGVTGLPTTFILDQQGILREKIVGETDLETIEKLLTTVLYKGGFYDSTY
jgi:cytochrome c biogenesis protein CcmG/thiol:disulfide interchange protein DsbE